MSLSLVFHPPGDVSGDALAAAAWHSDAFDFWAFDRHVDDLVARGAPLAITAPLDEVDVLSAQITLRTQRLEAHEPPTWLAPVVDEHRRLHDTTKALVLADLDHAHDTWQWSLRLDPFAPHALQLAALLHDIERLVSEADARIEHRAADYQAFKDAHARVGADLARELLARAGVTAALIDDACMLIATHERPDGSPELQAINDADALSFFSLNSPGYLAYFGAEQTARKVVYTLGRMSPRARAWLPTLRMPRLVRAYVHVYQLL